MRAIFVMIKCEMGKAYGVAREMADSIEKRIRGQGAVVAETMITAPESEDAE